MKKKPTGKRRRKAKATSPKAYLLRLATMLIICVALAMWGHSVAEESRGNAPAIPADSLQDVIIPDSLENVMVDYEGFSVAFNPALHIPNYAVWELTEQEVAGNLPRKSNFHADCRVPGCPTLDDYRNSGFDRGHMAPAADMKWSATAMDDSHSLANMCPQNPKINAGVWAKIEQRCRTWAARDSAIIIVCGPVTSDVMPQTIGATSVKVPRRFFKAILAPYANPPRAIAFIVPNNPVAMGFDKMVLSVDELEEITGFDFFHNLPDDVENEVEAHADLSLWDKAKK